MPLSDETAIRTQFEERARALYNKDAKAAVRHYADDIVNFDLAPPLAQRGREATDPAVLQGWFDSWDWPIGMAFEQVQVRVAGDLAFAFGFLHMTGGRTDGSLTDVWARFTVCLERRGDEWKIVHEHQSFPTKMDGSEKSASDLKP